MDNELRGKQEVIMDNELRCVLNATSMVQFAESDLSISTFVFPLISGIGLWRD